MYRAPGRKYFDATFRKAGAVHVPLQHLPSDTSADAVVESLRRNGYAIVDELVPTTLMDRIQAEMGGHIENTPFGNDISWAV